MNEQIIAFVVALLCSGALVTVYILWLAGLFSNRAKPQSVYTEMIKDAMILSKVEGWLEDEVVEHQDIADAYENNEEPIMADNTDEICVGRHEVAESLQNMIKQWRSEINLSVAKED